MPRPPITIDITGAQRILDKINEGDFSTESALCNFAAQEYNTNIGTPIIDNQLIKLRIKKEVLKLGFPMPKGKRGRQTGTTLTVEHKEKLNNGRIHSKEKFSSTTCNKKAAAELKEKWGGKYPKLVEASNKGNKSACIKLHCIACMGDDNKVRESIRGCTSYVCPLYSIRPYQKKDEV